MPSWRQPEYDESLANKLTAAKLRKSDDFSLSGIPRRRCQTKLQAAKILGLMAPSPIAVNKAVSSDQASENIKMHAPYAHYYIGFKPSKVTKIFNESPKFLANPASKPSGGIFALSGLSRTPPPN
ncbi:hypothetical protein BC829DRAFT_420241 [Chytridium lagenaria]|nr:hypothetical protein BC829DRAFT_420241 [Chytridium lagenaria]